MPTRIVECEFNQPPNRRCGRNTCKIKRALGPAKVLVHAFERGEIESRLAAEIMIDHALVGARAARNHIDAGAGQSIGGELHLRGREDCIPRAIGIASVSLAGGFGHAIVLVTMWL